MPRRLPPFPALFAFEAAARHLSFRLAAEELAGEEAAGRLVRVNPVETPEQVIYSVATLETRARLPKIAAFRAWMQEEAELAAPPALAAAGE